MEIDRESEGQGERNSAGRDDKIYRENELVKGIDE